MSPDGLYREVTLHEAREWAALNRKTTSLDTVLGLMFQ
jgi:hypothetical protein